MFHSGYCGHKLDHDLNITKNTAQEAEHPYHNGKRDGGTFTPYPLKMALAAGLGVAEHDKAGHLLAWRYPALPYCV